MLFIIAEYIKSYLYKSAISLSKIKIEYSEITYQIPQHYSTQEELDKLV
jgi:hypothetical protein